MRKLGLVIMHGRAVYGHNRGLMLPAWLLRRIAQLWNHAACRVLGHDDILWHITQHDPSFARTNCTHCLAPLHGCTGTALNERHSKTDQL